MVLVVGGVVDNCHSAWARAQDNYTSDYSLGMTSEAETGKSCSPKRNRSSSQRRRRSQERRPTTVSLRSRSRHHGREPEKRKEKQEKKDKRKEKKEKKDDEERKSKKDSDDRKSQGKKPKSNPEGMPEDDDDEVWQQCDTCSQWVKGETGMRMHLQHSQRHLRFHYYKTKNVKWDDARKMAKRDWLKKQDPLPDKDKNPKQVVAGKPDLTTSGMAPAQQAGPKASTAPAAAARPVSDSDSLARWLENTACLMRRFSR